MIPKNTNNKYDYLLILVISILIFGYYGSPIYPSRLLALLISPLVLNELYRKLLYIPSFVKSFFTIWIIMGSISILWSYDKGNGLKAFFYFYCNIICFFSLYLLGLKARNPIRSISIGWTSLFLLSVPFAIYEFTTGNHFITLHNETLTILGDEGFRIERSFASVTYGNLNKYNVIIGMCLPYVLFSFFYFKNIKTQLFLWGILLAIVYVTLMNASRGAFLYLSLALVIFFIYAQKYGVVNRIIIVIIPIAIGYVLYVNSDMIFSQISRRLAVEGINTEDSRFEIYSRGINLLQETLGIGVGLGGVNAALRTTTVLGVTAMHNMFLEFLVQFGVIPFAFFVHFIYRIYKGLLQNNETCYKFIGAVFAVILLPLFIINSNYLMDTDMWLYLGGAFAILQLNNNIK